MNVSLNHYDKTKNIPSQKTFPSKYTRIIGYIPVAGTFVGIYRLYKTLSSGKPKGKEMIRGSLEIAACGPILAIIDGLIYLVKSISAQLKKNKTDQKVSLISSKPKNVSKQPAKTAIFLKKSAPASEKIEAKIKTEEIAKKSLSSVNEPETKPVEKEPETLNDLSILEENPVIEPPTAELPIPPSQVIDPPKETTVREDINKLIDNVYDFFTSPKKFPSW